MMLQAINASPDLLAEDRRDMMTSRTELSTGIDEDVE